MRPYVLLLGSAGALSLACGGRTALDGDLLLGDDAAASTGGRDGSSGGVSTGGGSTGGASSGGISSGGAEPSTGGAAGSGGMHSGCAPTDGLTCYDGPPGTLDVGVCRAGHIPCIDGQWGTCVGQVLPAAVDDCTTPEDEYCDGVALGCMAEPFARRWGDGESQIATAVQAVPDGAWVTGRYWGTPWANGPVSEDSFDMFLTKVGLNGTVTKQLTFGGAGAQYPTGLARAPSGEIAVCGGFTKELELGSVKFSSLGAYDAFLARFDAQGNNVSYFYHGGELNQLFKDVAYTDAGELVAVGQFSLLGPTHVRDFIIGQVGGAAGDVVVMRFDDQSMPTFARSYGGPGFERASALALHASSTWVGGTYSGGTSLGCGEHPPLGGANDGYLARFDREGNCEGSVAIGATGDDYVTDVAIDAEGDVTVVGTFDGELTISSQTTPLAQGKGVYVLGLTQDFGLRFVRVLPQGTPGTKEYSPRLDVDAQGNVYVAGTFASTFTVDGVTLTNNGSNDAFALALDKSGTVLWGRAFGDASVQEAYAVSAGNELVFLAGAFQGTLSRAPNELVSQGSEDAFVIGLWR